jgi:hypothetical protein
MAQYLDVSMIGIYRIMGKSGQRKTLQGTDGLVMSLKPGLSFIRNGARAFLESLPWPWDVERETIYSLTFVRLP